MLSRLLPTSSGEVPSTRNIWCPESAQNVTVKWVEKMKEKIRNETVVRSK